MCTDDLGRVLAREKKKVTFLFFFSLFLIPFASDTMIRLIVLPIVFVFLANQQQIDAGKQMRL